MVIEKAVQETKDTKQDLTELTEFTELMNDVAGLPEEQREKVTYFAQGVIAANANRKERVQNE